MPYIKKEDRERLEMHGFFPHIMGEACHSEGELNYCVTRLCHGYLESVGQSYANLNAAIGVLECAKLELYRRLAAPYEDRKIAENGDVP